MVLDNIKIGVQCSKNILYFCTKNCFINLERLNKKSIQKSFFISTKFWIKLSGFSCVKSPKLLDEIFLIVYTIR